MRVKANNIFITIKLARRIVQVGSIPLWVALFILGRFEVIIAILIVALFSSLIVGRAFCSWLCPIGTFYELAGLIFHPERPRFWCRIGCPFSLTIGMLNRFSVMKVKKEERKCQHCGLCDDTCPVGLVDLGSSCQDFSSNPSRRYACVRCLNCITACPTGALSFGVSTSRHPPTTLQWKT